MRVRSRGLRTLLAGLAAVLPRGMRRFVHTRLLGYRLHPTATIGHSVVDVDELVMAEDARIGHLVLVRGCEEARLGPSAAIGALVWVNSVRADKGLFAGHPRRPALLMGRHAVITMLHLIDACDLVELDDFAAIAGFGTIVQTHAVDLDRLRQSSAPVRLGHHASVFTRCLLLPGAEVPDRSIVAAGAVVTGPLKGHQLFAGVPARPVRDVDPGDPFFTRDSTEFS